MTYLNPLDRTALRNILTEPKNSIIKQYVKLFEMDGVKLEFQPEVFEYIVDKAIEYKLGDVDKRQGRNYPRPSVWQVGMGGT